MKRKLPICTHESKKDLSQGLGEKRHLYCPSCGWHFFDGKGWLKKDWLAYVNGDIIPLSPDQKAGREGD